MMDTIDPTAILQQLGRTYRSYTALFEDRVGMPVPRWRILIALCNENAPVSQKGLARGLRMDPGALTRQLKPLEALGWIARATDPNDNRLTNVELTDAGRDVYRAGLPLRNALLAELFETLPEEAMSGLSDGLTAIEARVAGMAAARGAAE